MVEIILIELISIVSFLYSLWLMFAFFAPINEVFIVFIWTIGISLICALICDKNKIFNLIILLLFLPIRFCSDKASIFFITISSLFIFLYIKKSLLRGNYYQYAATFKKTYLFYIVVLYFRILLDGFEGSIDHAAPFIIIHILSSVILTRTIRHLDSGMDMEKIRKNNIRYLIFMAIVFSIATFKKLRTFLWTGISKVLDTIIYAIFYPLYLFGTWISPDPVEIVEEEVDLDMVMGDLPEMETLKVSEEIGEKFLNVFPIIKKVLGIVLLGVLIYIIYKIIIRAGDRNYIDEEFTEEREYIQKEKKKRGIFNREKYPKEFGQQIRYYYRRYLEKLGKSDIEVLETDTSFEVNEKAEEIFSDEIEDIRDIYINTRYGEKNVDENVVEEMKTLYKKL